MRPRSRWSPTEHLVQVSASLGSLIFGYYLVDLLTALLFGLTGYLGTGWGLALRHRKRVFKQARAALDRGLAQLEQSLSSILLAKHGERGAAMQEALELCEADLQTRQSQVAHLRGSAVELKRLVEHYESTAWLDAVQGED